MSQPPFGQYGQQSQYPPQPPYQGRPYAPPGPGQYQPQPQQPMRAG
jgi:hypothetical protein